MSQLFEQIGGNSAVAVTVDNHCESTTLFVAFGGISGGFGVPIFEFLKLAGRFPVKKLFIRDPAQAWYQRGLPGIGQSVRDIALFLGRRIAEMGVHRVVMAGNSAGGYAALLFGNLLDANEILAFAPQTFLGRGRRLLHCDFRWRRQIDQAIRHSVSSAHLDLSSLFRTRPSTGRTHVFYCERDRLDACHAKRLQDNEHVQLHAFAHGGHQVVKWMRDTGLLATTLCQALQVDQQSVTMDHV